MTCWTQTALLCQIKIFALQKIFFFSFLPCLQGSPNTLRTDVDEDNISSAGSTLTSTCTCNVPRGYHLPNVSPTGIEHIENCSRCSDVSSGKHLSPVAPRMPHAGHLNKCLHHEYYVRFKNNSNPRSRNSPTYPYTHSPLTPYSKKSKTSNNNQHYIDSIKIIFPALCGIFQFW